MAAVSVLVVDDSVVVRRIVSQVLGEDPMIEVVGVAANGRIALDKLAQVKPDLVTLDIEMPVLDGLGTLRELRRTHPKLPVVMFSTLTERGASATLDALALGASDYVTKPANVGSVPKALEAVRTQLIPKIYALCGVRPPAPSAGAGRAAVPAPRPAGSRPPPAPAPGGPKRPVEVLAIGSSTGGPDALAVLLPALPADLAVPVLVTQHMPPVFTRMFAQRLDKLCPLPVREAVDGEPAAPGTVLVAPGDFHLTLVRDRAGTRVELSTAAPENFCRPAVDVMFRSITQVYGGATLSVVLTGMGQDGMRGAEVVRAAGGSVIAQDEASSVVWGMPGAVTDAGLAERVLPLREIADELRRRIRPAVRAGAEGAP